MARLLLLVVLIAAAVGGCARASVGNSGEQGYVGGTGTITQVAVAERKAPGPVSGTSLDGAPLSLSDFRGKVVVVNVWGSWCTDCREEAPMLARAARALAGHDVAFLGIDSRDANAAQARAYVERFHLGYPSIYDQAGRTLLAFRGTLTPNSIPSTVIIDRQGRVAASVLGTITRTTLDDLVAAVSGQGAS